MDFLQATVTTVANSGDSGGAGGDGMVGYYQHEMPPQNVLQSLVNIEDPLPTVSIGVANPEPVTETNMADLLASMDTALEEAPF